MAFVENPQKVELAKVIEANGLNPLDFKPTDLEMAYKLKYLDSGLTITFHMSPDDFSQFCFTGTTFNPSRKGFNDRTRYLNMHDTKSYFDKWIRANVIAYNTSKNTPDPWKTPRAEFYDFIPDEQKADETTRFTENEIKTLTASINKLREFVIDKLNESQVINKIATIETNAKFDYMIDRLDKETRGRWKFDALNLIGSIIITLSLDHETGKQLYHMLFEAVRLISTQAQTFIDKL